MQFKKTNRQIARVEQEAGHKCGRDKIGELMNLVQRYKTMVTTSVWYSN